MSNSFLCPCCSEKPYSSCCEPFHKGALPTTAEQLMRARYSAYAKNLPLFIIKTTHPCNPDYDHDTEQWKESISSFSQTTQFTKLDIDKVIENPYVALICFQAYLKQGGKTSSFREESLFEKYHGKWLYKGVRLVDTPSANPLTSGVLRLLPLAYLGEDILRKKAERVEKITQELHTLVEHMIETMDACDGLGLAAPQVHHSLQLFVIRKPTVNPRGDLELGPIKVFINPHITSRADNFWQAQEGCLSIPGVRAQVKRPKDITITYQNLQGDEVTEKVSGWEARVIQHEYDHLQGILFYDHLAEKEKKKLDPKLHLIQRRFHDHKEL